MHPSNIRHIAVRLYVNKVLRSSSVHACSLMKTLLQHYTKQERCPPGLSLNSGSGSIILGLAAGLWSALTLGYGSQHSNKEDHHREDALLATQSSLLILVLANHCTSDKAIQNPYRQALFCFTNSSGECIFWDFRLRNQF